MPTETSVSPALPALPERPKTRSDMELVEIDGEGLVFHGGTGYVHLLNPLAKLVWELCDGKGTVGESAAGIAEAFGTPREVVEKDMERILRTFANSGLLEGVPGLEEEQPAPGSEPELVRLDVEASP